MANLNARALKKYEINGHKNGGCPAPLLNRIYVKLNKYNDEISPPSK